MTSARRAARRVSASGLFLVAILTLVWGCNWPVLKLGVTELAPLTFRGATLPFAAIGLLLAARLSGDSIRIPREHWGKVLALALFNIAAWNGLILFGVQQMPAGRSAILAYTMPVWTVLFGMALLHEPLSRRKIIGLALGMLGMAVLLGEDVRHITRSPMGTFVHPCRRDFGRSAPCAAVRWKPPLPQNTLTGWMMLIGWLPIAVCVPLFDEHPISSLAHMSGTAWFAVLTTSFSPAPSQHWAWFTMARTLPVAVSSLRRCRCRSSACCREFLSWARPGPSEYIALALVLASLSAVLFAPATKPVIPPE
jgi:drug/metabolite transporter (DMT)-like permease